MTKNFIRDSGIQEKLVRMGKVILQILFNKSYFKMFVDEKGIPINDYGYINGVYVGKQRSIVAVAEKGLDYWNKYQLGGMKDKLLLSYDWKKFPENKENSPKNSTEARRMFLNCANWLIEHATYYEDYAVWEYSYPSFYDTKPGWRSSQAQALGIQLLIRAYKLTNDPKYLNCAKHSLRVFCVSVEDGGVTDKASSEEWWYDKFADVECTKPKVLNGMMFALFGIHDFYEWTNDSDAKFLFDNGIISLRKHLREYDAGYYSYYDRLGNVASQHYHNIHIQQLAQLYDITGDTVFKRYHDKFNDYEENYNG